MALNAFSVMRRIVGIDDGMKVLGFLNECLSIVTTETSFIRGFFRFLKIGSMTSLARYTFCDMQLRSGFC